MRPEREGGVTGDLMGGVGARPSLWHTPTPYLFMGFGLMIGLIAVALLVLVCTRRKPSSRRGGAASGDHEVESSVRVLVPLDREPKVVVIMAGDHAPSFLASARPLVAFVPTTGGQQAGDGAV